jgi:hypothetical protein
MTKPINPERVADVTPLPVEPFQGSFDLRSPTRGGAAAPLTPGFVL